MHLPWLVVPDTNRASSPRERTVFCQYGEDIQQNEKGDILHYVAGDVEKGIVIDITGDQYDELAIYVGELDCFYKNLNLFLLMTCAIL